MLGVREVARCGGGHISDEHFHGRGGQGIVRFRGLVEVNVAVTHWDWRVRGCCLEGLESQDCLAGLLDVCGPMALPAWRL